jgi:hypothetical protein
MPRRSVDVDVRDLVVFSSTAIELGPVAHVQGLIGGIRVCGGRAPERPRLSAITIVCALAHTVEVAGSNPAPPIGWKFTPYTA